jgi:PAS domain S-box-containing protein
LEVQLDSETKRTATEIKSAVSEERISFLRLIQAILFPAAYWIFIEKSGTDTLLATLVTIAVLFYSLYVIIKKPYKKFNPVSFSFLSSFLDSVIVFLWIYATGAKDSPFFALTLVTILSIAFRTGIVFTYLSGVAYIVLYALVHFFTPNTVADLTEFGINSSFIAIATLIGAVISKEIFKQTVNVIKIKKLSFDLKQSLELLEEKSKSESMLASIVKNSNDAIIGKNLESIITSWNPGAEKIFGYKSEEILGKHIKILFPADRLMEEQKFMKNILKGESVRHFETLRIRKDGKPIDVSVSLSPIRNHEGKIIGASKIARDITEQKNVFLKVEELNKELSLKIQQLKEMNEDLESFSYSVSHDLRTPLRGINGYASILLEDFSEKLEGEAKRLLEGVKGNSERMNKLIEDLLSFSRMSRKDIKKEVVDIRGIFKEVENSLSDSLKRKYKIVIDDLPPAYADKDLLRQVIINLFSNAVKYSSKTPEPLIEIKAFKREGENVYCIKDNGVGFDMAYVDKLFGVFKRLHTEQEFEGSGVGLAIVKRIITKHGGRVWAQAEPKKGAEFYFSLPSKMTNVSD